MPAPYLLPADFGHFLRYIEMQGVSVPGDFMFQLLSHPHYPTILSVSDTLLHYDISHEVLKVPFEDIDHLPKRFASLHRDHKGVFNLCAVKRSGANRYVINGRRMPEAGFANGWSGIVLLVQPQSERFGKRYRKAMSSILYTTLVLVSFGLVYQLSSSWKHVFLTVLPILGLSLTILTMTGLFISTGNRTSSFCEQVFSTDCETVISSERWSILRFVNFSDLGLIFFFAQILTSIYYLFISDQHGLHLNTTFQLAASILPIILSLYYQKFVIKKWCPVCMMIIIIVLFEASCLLFNPMDLDLPTRSESLWVTVFALLAVAFGWMPIRHLLNTIRLTKEKLITANRLLRDYQIFKPALLIYQPFDIPPVSWIDGDPSGKVIISVITNPFCRYCKKMHELLTLIGRRFPANVRISITMRIDKQDYTNRAMSFYRSLLAISTLVEKEALRTALTDWYSSGNIDKWLIRYEVQRNEWHSIDEHLENVNDWCEKNGLLNTPVVLINGYRFPVSYDPEYLLYFINDLIEDSYNGKEVSGNTAA